MYLDMKREGRMLSSAACSARRLWKSAEDASPRMKKELTVRSRYYASGDAKEPCGETFLRLGCDCGMLRLFVILILIAAAMAMFAMLFLPHRRKR